jgi:glycosyltransferase involved in cell wall biosynthesis
MRPLRVAVVAPSLKILGGQSIQAQRLLMGWRGDDEVEAWLVPHNPTPPRFLRWATAIRYARTVVTESTYLPLLFRELRRADVVHVFSASYTSFLLAPLPAILFAKALGRPVVVNYRSGEAPDHLRRSSVARWALKRADANAVPSPFLRDVFGGFGIDAVIVPNVVDVARFVYHPRDPLRPRLLSTRNMDALYNVACTIRAFRRIQDRWPDASLTLVGGGREERQLRQMSVDLGLRNVTFTGRVDPEAIHSFYESHDIYVQSPNIDNTPGSVLEAFASGLPVVSTEAGGVPAILRHEQDGLLVPLDDAEALAAGVLRLLDNPKWARGLAASARGTLDQCRWPQVREQWLRLYRDLASQQGRAVRRSAVQA